MTENTRKPMVPLDHLQERLVSVESTLTYLQHDFEQLNQVVLEQQKQLLQLQKQLNRWEEKIAQGQMELPDPLDEKPPHY